MLIDAGVEYRFMEAQTISKPANVKMRTARRTRRFGFAFGGLFIVSTKRLCASNSAVPKLRHAVRRIRHFDHRAPGHSRLFFVGYPISKNCIDGFAEFLA